MFSNSFGHCNQMIWRQKLSTFKKMGSAEESKLALKFKISRNKCSAKTKRWNRNRFSPNYSFANWKSWNRTISPKFIRFDTQICNSFTNSPFFPRVGAMSMKFSHWKTNCNEWQTLRQLRAVEYASFAYKIVLSKIFVASRNHVQSLLGCV